MMVEAIVIQVLDTITVEALIPRVIIALVQIFGIAEEIQEEIQVETHEKTREEINHETLLSLYVADLQ